MSIFNVDFTKLIKLMLPVKVRSISIVAFLKTMVSPVIWLYEIFIIKRAEDLYRVSHNGQICRLEKVLNDRFDNIDRRIYIEDGVAILPKWMYRRVEEKEVYFRRRSEAAAVFMRRRSEMTFGGSFVIVLPIGLVYDLAELKSITDTYKYAGKTYTIKTI